MAAIAAVLLWQRQVVGTLLAMLLLSATIGYLITPLSRWLEQKLSPKWGPPLAFLALALVVAAWFASFLPLLVRQAIALAEQLPAIWEQVQAFVTSLEARVLAMGLPKEQVQAIVAQLAEKGSEWLSSLSGGLGSFAQGLADSGWILLSPLLAYYMVRDRRALFDWIERMIPSRIRRIALEIGAGIRDALRGYVRGQVIVSLITGALTSLGLLILGMPSWLLLGFLMAVFNLIPYFGPVIGAIPILIITGTEGLWMLLKALIVVVAAQQLESMVITPRVLGGASDLHPAIVLVGIFLGGIAAGLAGMVFALPAMLIVRVVVRRLVNIRLYGTPAASPIPEVDGDAPPLEEDLQSDP